MGLKREEIEAIASRVVQLLQEERPAATPRNGEPLVDAATLAQLLGVSRATVYAKAEELGAIRLGNGERARLRFDPGRLVATRGSTGSGPTPDRSRRRPSSSRLLPIRPAARRGTRRRSGD